MNGLARLDQGAPALFVHVSSAYSQMKGHAIIDDNVAKDDVNWCIPDSSALHPQQKLFLLSALDVYDR